MSYHCSIYQESAWALTVAKERFQNIVCYYFRVFGVSAKYLSDVDFSIGVHDMLPDKRTQYSRTNDVLTMCGGISLKICVTEVKYELYYNCFRKTF